MQGVYQALRRIAAASFVAARAATAGISCGLLENNEAEVDVESEGALATATPSTTPQVAPELCAEMSHQCNFPASEQDAS